MVIESTREGETRMFLHPLEGEVLVHCRTDEVRMSRLQLSIPLTEACIECAVRLDFGPGEEPKEAQPVLYNHGDNTIIGFFDNVLSRERVRRATDVPVNHGYGE